MMRLPSTGWEKMSTFLEIYLICIINACSYGFLVACEHLWHAWNALVRLFQRIYQAPYPPLLMDQGRLARITLPDGAEVLRSTAAGSLEQLAVRLDDELAPILHQHRLSCIYLSRAAVPLPSTETIYLC